MRCNVFQAIADPTRRAILGLLSIQAMTPNAPAEHFDSSRQAICRHIKILAECRLLNQEQSGREIYYYFNSKKTKRSGQMASPFPGDVGDPFYPVRCIIKNH